MNRGGKYADLQRGSRTEKKTTIMSQVSIIERITQWTLKLAKKHIVTFKAFFSCITSS